MRAMVSRTLGVESSQGRTVRYSAHRLALLAALALLAVMPAAPTDAAGGEVVLPALLRGASLPGAEPRPLRAIPSPTAPPKPSQPAGTSTAPVLPSPTPVSEPSPTSPLEPMPADDCPDEAFMDLSAYPGAGAQYPDPELAVSCRDDELIIIGNGIPHYAFVPITPNPLVAVAHEYHIPLHPVLASETSALPRLGTAGVAVNGLPFFGPNEAAVPAAQAWGDPVYNGIMDACLGHTAAEYHYHALQVDCLGGAEPGRPSPIIGFATDGFPIHGPFGCLDSDCETVVELQSSWVRIADPRTNAWDAYAYREQEGAAYLDRCNGRVGPDGRYRYHATSGFPYIIGCYAGTPKAQAGGGAGRPGPGPRPRPLIETLFDWMRWPLP